LFWCSVSAHQNEKLANYIQVLLKSNDYVNCINSCNNFLINVPGDTNVLLTRIICRYNAGQYYTTLEEINNLLHKKLQHDALYNYKGLCLLKTLDYRAAKRAFIEAINFNSSNCEYYFNLGYTYILTNSWNNAVNELTQAINIKPDFTEAYVNRAYAYSMNGNFNEAITDYNFVLKENFYQPDILIKRAMVLISLKKYQQAIQSLNLAVKLNPKSPHAYYNLGRAFYELKQFNDAKLYFDTSLVIKPDFEVALFNRALANLELSLSNKNLACEDLRHAAQLGYGEAWEYLKKYCR